MFFDPWYFVFVAPAVLLAAWAQWRVSSAYAHASRIAAASGYSGAETAAAVMRRAGVGGVDIQTVPGQLTDHYSPGEKVLRLSPDVFEGRSLAALGIAAHEAGHAIQDARRYTPLVVRNEIVPLAGFGSNISWLLIILGFAMQWAGLIYLGIAAFGLTVVFQLVNLPVEFDASRRARLQLVEGGLIAPEEEREVARVLNAAALTYVAAALTAVLTLLYFLFRAGAFSRR
jgi:Zn-dependent membrane protease YugP